jgi:hypothetical protein
MQLFFLNEANLPEKRRNLNLSVLKGDDFRGRYLQNYRYRM